MLPVTMRAASTGCMRGWTGRRGSAANTSAIECRAINPLSRPAVTRSSAVLACAWCGWLCSEAATRTVVSKKISTWLRFQNGLNPLLAHVFKDALPVCPRFCDALMDPQTIDLDHGRPLFGPLEKHALRLLNSHQLRVRLEAEPLPGRFWDDNPPRFIDPEFHTINNTIYHLQWQSWGDQGAQQAGQGSGGTPHGQHERPRVWSCGTVATTATHSPAPLVGNAALLISKLHTII